MKSNSSGFPVTPQGNKSGRVVVDPVSRIEGHLRIEVELKDGKIANAWSSSTLFRGLEIILKGRKPEDAQHFTQRSCGVCTYVHGLASTRAAEDACNVTIPENATLIRNLVMGSQYMHDHLVHFYHLCGLDWIDVAGALKADPKKAASIANSISPRQTKVEDLKAVQATLKKFVDSGQLGPFTNAYFLNGHEGYYLSPELNLIGTAHYLEALKIQLLPARAMAIFGGKNPHPQFMQVGGVTCYKSLEKEKLKQFRDLLMQTKNFIDQVYIPDLLAIAGQYKDWTQYGGCTNFLTFGEFPTKGQELDSRYFPAGIVMNRDFGNVQKFDPNKIAEHVRYSWYEGDKALHPYKGETDPKYTEMFGEDRYSWMKAPRYEDKAMETGPLAQVLVAYAKGHPKIKPLVDHVLNTLGIKVENLYSTLGRIAARGIETAVAAEHCVDMLDQLEANLAAGKNQIIEDVDMVEKGEGVGFVNAPRGGLSHWLKVKEKKIDNFQLVVPSTWNLGPRCANDLLSPVEEALVGTPVADAERPVEILRTVHSFDPCIACGVHVIDGNTNKVHKFKIR
ncbi:nickel-dependent hydrogenase large subunit [Halodesulfovibrio aestuarii]|uniref:Periplasmic [NiFe] hydrogenase large subunit n=1 Tax=Halodesulfovibrio aestuarii TaxID=126333 RepID=A0A8G2C7K4_9BACT|nr:nickel-dependent hydrogenase large subunit [Halodesulfovibrio aestuarii]SHI65534.1 [NiFe] hydrogenase large subunit [Halodesulfovibrio aestuarii]